MSVLSAGKILRGRISTYTLKRRIQGSIWLATNTKGQNVVVKSCHRDHLEKERDILQHFRMRNTSLRPLVDEIVDANGTPSIVLKHLDDDLLHASNTKRLTSPEIKYIAHRVLSALRVLHEDGYVHTDVKLDHVLVNFGQHENRFTDVELASCGSAVHKDSKYPKEGMLIGEPIWRSPEAQLQMRWGTATDIWSFGTMIISLIWGENFHIFRPEASVEAEDYELTILMKQNEFFWTISHIIQ